MANYIDNYRKAHNIGDQDIIMCEKCREKIAVDIHHKKYRSQGGSDKAHNLIALCRACHNLFH